jgi:hypothetical protein
VHDKLRVGFGVLSRLRIDGFNAPANRLTALVHVTEVAVLWLTRAEEVGHVATQNQVAGLLGRRLRGHVQRGNREPGDNNCG